MAARTLLVSMEVDAPCRPAWSRRQHWAKDLLAGVERQLLARGARRLALQRTDVGYTVRLGFAVLFRQGVTPGELGVRVEAAADELGLTILAMAIEAAPRGRAVFLDQLV